MVNPLIFHSIVILIGIFIILKSADYVIYGVDRYARKLGMSGTATGLIIISIAASMPEIMSALNGLLVGNSDVLFGSLIGNNFVHMGLLIGLIIIFSKNVSLEYAALKKSIIIIGVLFLLPFFLMADGKLSQMDGVLLLAGFVGYLIILWRTEHSKKPLKQVKFREIWKEGLIFIMALGALLLGARLLVFSSIQIAQLLEIPAFLIAITIIGVGGALDDFAIGIQSIKRKVQSIGVGDAIGSVMNEFLLFFGIVGIINPIAVPVGKIWLGAIFLIMSTFLTLLLLRLGKVRRWHGVVLIGFYFIYIGIEIGKVWT